MTPRAEPPPMPFLSAPRAQPAAGDDTLRIETTTLLPGGALVVVSVRHKGEGYDVSDEGQGRETMLALGVQDVSRADTRRGNDIAQSFGLAFDGVAFRVAGVGEDQLVAAVAYVAEACRSWTAAAIEARATRRQRNLLERATQRLRAALPGHQIDLEREVQGASTKRHRFDLVVDLPGERLAVFELLTPAPASIAAAHLKFYDLMQAHGDWPREAVVENLAEWPSEDLAVMQPVATHVRGLGGSWDDLAALAA